MIRAYAASEPGGSLRPFTYEPAPLDDGDVEIAVESCGVCHSDISVWSDDWGMASYPFVPGHEVIGRVAAKGARVTHLREGDRVGLGWFSSSCMTCGQCMSGDHNLCPSREQTIVGRFGGFAERVRAGAEWAAPLPETIDAAKAGPLFCGGITVFNPIVQFDVRPTWRVGVVGVGGLGHLALQFLNKWGCEVTAFTSTGAKAEEARRLGAHNIVDSRDKDAIAGLNGALDFILVTANVTLPWNAYLSALAPRGRLHVVGAPAEPIPAPAFGLISNQLSISGSPLGSPATMAEMLAFCARHGITAVTEHLPMAKADEAFAKLKAGNVRYRMVLEADF